MSTMTIKGQVTIPKKIRDTLNLLPGADVQFVINDTGEIVIRPAISNKTKRSKDRFEKARGSAQVKWRTDTLMALLRDS